MKALVTECQNLRYSLGAYYERQGLRQRQLDERRALLAGSETVIEISNLHEAASLQRSNTAADGLIELGHSILEELGSQSERLKRIRGSVLGIASSLGVSKSLLRVIERRQITDKTIPYGGMIACVVFLVIMWWYFK